MLLSSLFHMLRLRQEVVPALTDWCDYLKGFLRRAGENWELSKKTDVQIGWLCLVRELNL